MSLSTALSYVGGRNASSPRPGARAIRLGIVATWLTTGCAAGSAAPVGAPVPDPSAAAIELVSATALTERQQINFAWTLDEAGSRVRGRGVVRVQPPERLRLDLFGPRNETYLSAALVGDEARLPPAARSDVAIPSPALLWAGLGTIRPPRGASLESATSTGEQTVLRYRVSDGDLYEYRVGSGLSPRLDQLQRVGPRGPLETVRIERSGDGAIARAVYRDWSAFRDLTLEIQAVEAAELFSESIWTP